jgi:endonuclease/exonuclease/phosphatase (EEP) superfamily protein YafD
MNLKYIRVIFWGNFFLSLVAVFVIAVSRLVGDVFVVELFASFFPTIFLLSFVMFLATVVAGISSYKRNFKWILGCLSVSLVCWLVCLVVTGGVVGGFWFQTVEKNSNNTENSLKVVFLNKLYTNGNTSLIKEAIIKSGADVVGMAEVTKNDFKLLQNSRYPYSYLTDCVCVFGGAQNAIFSKYPLEDVGLKVFGNDSGLILVANVKKQDRLVRVFVVHPHSPVSQYDVEMRAQDLGYISGLVRLAGDVPVVVMGDFNTPPWSLTYSEFTKRLGSNFLNTSSGMGVNFTWGKFLFQTQIDHIFVSKSIKVVDFKVLEDYGSDHNMIEASVMF